MLFNESEKSIVLKQWFFAPLMLEQWQWLQLRPVLVEINLIEYPVSLLEYMTKEQAKHKRRAATDVSSLKRAINLSGAASFDHLLCCSTPGTDYTSMDQMKNIWLGR